MTVALDVLLVPPGASPFSVDSWETASIVSFENRMLDTVNKFPCIFGVDAVARKTLRYGFIRQGYSAARQLADTLHSFTAVCEDLGKRTSLVVFFETWHADERTHESYYHQFWNLLRDTADYDTEPWPDEYSADTGNATFEYCFNGVPMFVVVNTDIHKNRRSREFERVAITFQPRFVFDDIKAGTPTGDNARKIIRGRILGYDNAPLTKLLGNYGDSDNKEWQQYYLDDGADLLAQAQCPVSFLHRKEK